MNASNRLVEAINTLQKIMVEDGVDPTKGLPE